MKEINTLLFSGCGIKCYSILGSLKFLIENNIIKENFKGIKEIFYTSGSAIFTFPLFIGFSINATIEIFKNIDYSLINIIDLTSLEYLLSKFGLKDIREFYYIIEIILKKKNIDIDINLKQLYHLNNININFKTVNITKDTIEYLNHINNPDLTLKKAIIMTSCIPIIFSPIEHNGSLYIDGGMVGNFPYEKINNKDHSLGFNIVSANTSLDTSTHKESFNYEDITKYILYLYNIHNNSPYKSNKKRHIQIEIKLDSLSPGFNFNAFIKNLDQLFNKGYQNTKLQFKGLNG